MRIVKYKRDLTMRFYKEIISLKLRKELIKTYEYKIRIHARNNVSTMQTQDQFHHELYQRLQIAKINILIEEEGVNRFGERMWNELLPENTLGEFKIEEHIHSMVQQNV